MKKHPEHVNIQIVMKKENVFIIAQNIIRLFALLVIQIYAAQHRLHLTALRVVVAALVLSNISWLIVLVAIIGGR